MPGVGTLHPRKETGRDTKWNPSNGTGCLKSINTKSLCILAGIAPPDIRRAVASHSGRTRQTTGQRHPLNVHLGEVPCLKSRKSLIKCTQPINTPAIAARIELWRERLEPHDASVHLNIYADEHLPAGAENPWTSWMALNRLRTHVGRSRRVNILKWGFSNEAETCDCGIRQTMQHLLVCPMMNTACSIHDLTTANGIAIGCARHWEGTICQACVFWWQDKNADDRAGQHSTMALNHHPFELQLCNVLHRKL